MSVHCDRCFVEIKKKGCKACPSCGNAIKAVRDLKSAPAEKESKAESLESGETGGEAAVNEELEEGSYSTGKYAAINPLIMKLRGAAALGGGAYVGVKAKKELEKGLKKQARAAHKANPVLNMQRRSTSVKSVDAYRKKFKNTARKFTLKGLALVR
jgi:hypothetical protein